MQQRSGRCCEAKPLLLCQTLDQRRTNWRPLSRCPCALFLAYALDMAVLGQVVITSVLLAASPVGAWYTNRHPAVRNDTRGGALGITLSWLGFVIALAFCAWRARRMRRELATDLSRP